MYFHTKWLRVCSCVIDVTHLEGVCGCHQTARGVCGLQKVRSLCLSEGEDLER